MKHMNLRRKVTELKMQLAPTQKPKVIIHAWVPEGWRGNNPEARIQIIPSNRSAQK